MLKNVWAPLVCSILFVCYVAQYAGVPDLKMYESGVTAAVHGQDPYAQTGFIYPPSALLVLIPAWKLGFMKLAFHLTQIVSIFMVYTILVRWFPGKKSFVLIGMVALGVPLAENVLMGNMAVQMLAAELLGIELSLRGRRFWGGTVLGMAASVKVTPILILGYMLLGRRHRVTGLIGLVGFVLCIGLASVVWPAHTEQFYSEVLPLLKRAEPFIPLAGSDYAWSSSQNASTVAVMRQAMGSVETAMRTATLLNAVLALVGLLLLRTLEDRGLTVAVWSLVIASTGLFSPMNWSINALFLLPVVVATLSETSNVSILTKPWHRALAITAYMAVVLSYSYGFRVVSSLLCFITGIVLILLCATLHLSLSPAKRANYYLNQRTG